MPIKIQKDLPVRKVLEYENIFMMDEERAEHQDIRPLHVLILNLMPEKEDTELELLRLLSNTPLQVETTLLRVKNSGIQEKSNSHLEQFYVTIDQIIAQKYDGMIITGAPWEKVPFEEVDCWQEIIEIFEWTKTHVTSTIHICWAAQAALHYHFGLQKVNLEEKLFGVYEHYVLNRKEPIIRGFDDIFLAPYSQYTCIPTKDIHDCDELIVLAESATAGVLLMMTKDHSQFFVTGHLEYDRMTLDKEYKLDLKHNIPTHIPYNYYPDNNPKMHPNLTWRSHSSNFFDNWLNYCVYQKTPYDRERIATL